MALTGMKKGMFEFLTKGEDKRNYRVASARKAASELSQESKIYNKVELSDELYCDITNIITKSSENNVKLFEDLVLNNKTRKFLTNEIRDSVRYIDLESGIIGTETKEGILTVSKIVFKCRVSEDAGLNYDTMTQIAKVIETVGFKSAKNMIDVQAIITALLDGLLRNFTVNRSAMEQYVTEKSKEAKGMKMIFRVKS